jgi:uncharacterized repeat protein (TIGR01451 family)
MTTTPHPAPVGGKLVYTLFVTNTGPATFTNVLLTETLPANTLFVGAMNVFGSTTQTSSNITFSLGTLTNKASAQVMLTITPTGIGLITNLATLSVQPTDADSCHNAVRSLATVVASNAPPVLLLPWATSGGPSGFTLQGIPGRTYSLLSSTNLSSWDSLGSVLNSNSVDGPLPFTNNSKVFNDREFYRAILLAP